MITDKTDWVPMRDRVSQALRRILTHRSRNTFHLVYPNFLTIRLIAGCDQMITYALITQKHGNDEEDLNIIIYWNQGKILWTKSIHFSDVKVHSPVATLAMLSYIMHLLMRATNDFRKSTWWHRQYTLFSESEE